MLAWLRVGCVIATEARWHTQIIAASDVCSTVTGASVLSQVAATVAITGAGNWLREFLRHLHAQRDYVLEQLACWPGVTTEPLQGTYVAIPNVSALDADAERRCTTCAIPQASHSSPALPAGSASAPPTTYA